MGRCVRRCLGYRYGSNVRETESTMRRLKAARSPIDAGGRAGSQSDVVVSTSEVSQSVSQSLRLESSLWLPIGKRCISGHPIHPIHPIHPATVRAKPVRGGFGRTELFVSTALRLRTEAEGDSKSRIEASLRSDTRKGKGSHSFTRGWSKPPLRRTTGKA